MEYEFLSLKALKLMRITATIGSLFLLLAGIVASVILAYNTKFLIATIVACLSITLFTFILLVIPPLRFRRYKYLIAEDRVEIIEGILFIRRTIVPIDRIHQIDIEKGPLDNLVGVAKVIVTTAGSAAAFRFLEPERADQIAIYLNKNINEKVKKKF